MIEEGVIIATAFTSEIQVNRISPTIALITPQPPNQQANTRMQQQRTHQSLTRTLIKNAMIQRRPDWK